MPSPAAWRSLDHGGGCWAACPAPCSRCWARERLTRRPWRAGAAGGAPPPAPGRVWQTLRPGEERSAPLRRLPPTLRQGRDLPKVAVSASQAVSDQVSGEHRRGACPRGRASHMLLTTHDSRLTFLSPCVEFGAPLYLAALCGTAWRGSECAWHARRHGQVPEWPIGPGCKPGGGSLRRFESVPAHRMNRPAAKRPRRYGPT